MARGRPRDLSDEEARAEAEILREARRRADREDAPYLASMWAEMAQEDLEEGYDIGDVGILISEIIDDDDTDVHSNNSPDDPKPIKSA
jgi:hypothetical protein